MSLSFMRATAIRLVRWLFDVARKHAAEHRLLIVESPGYSGPSGEITCPVCALGGRSCRPQILNSRVEWLVGMSNDVQVDGNFLMDFI